MSVRMALKVTGARQRLMSVSATHRACMARAQIGGQTTSVNVNWDTAVRIVLWSSPVAWASPATTTVPVNHIWKMKPTRVTTVLARMVTTDKTVLRYVSGLWLFRFTTCASVARSPCVENMSAYLIFYFLFSRRPFMWHFVQ